MYSKLYSGRHASRHAHTWCQPSRRTCKSSQPAHKPVGLAAQETAVTENLVPPQEDVPHVNTTPPHEPYPFVSLVAVSLLWGTYSPALRYLYSFEHAPSPAVLTAARTIVSAAALLGTVILWRPVTSKSKRTAITLVEPGGSKVHESANKLLSGQFIAPVVLAGVELGLWNFGGTALQAQGIEAVTATKAAFLGQLTTVLTPLLSYLIGDTITYSSAVACIVGFAGSCLICLDTIGGLEGNQTQAGTEQWQGVLFLLAGCLFYAICTVRIGKHAPLYDSLELTTSKVITLAGLSSVWALAEVPRGVPADEQMLLQLQQPFTLAILLYSALGPGALASVLQARGQALVPASQAQVIFSLTPLWSALFAYFLLEGESMGPLAWCGGGLVILAGLLVTKR